MPPERAVALLELKRRKGEFVGLAANSDTLIGEF
jgi:hypothetical protein